MPGRGAVCKPPTRTDHSICNCPRTTGAGQCLRAERPETSPVSLESSICSGVLLDRRGPAKGHDVDMPARVQEIEFRIPWNDLLTPITDASATEGVAVRSILPSGFERYLRVFHPFVPWDAEFGPATTKRSWRQFAEDAAVAVTNAPRPARPSATAHGHACWRPRPATSSCASRSSARAASSRPSWSHADGSTRRSTRS